MQRPLPTSTVAVATAAQPIWMPAFPALLLAGHLALLLLPATRGVGIGLARENGVVELLTVLFMVAGGIIGFRYLWRQRHGGESRLVKGFIAFFSVGLIFTAGEEIAWGQTYLHFETPEALAEHNVQGQTTLHNLEGLQGNMEWFHLFFGIGGLVGIWLPRLLSSFAPHAERIHQLALRLAPAPSHAAWFAVIIAATLLNLVDDFSETEGTFRTTMRNLSETTEMLIGIVGFLFVRHVAR